jgi:hypothetical protein
MALPEVRNLRDGLRDDFRRRLARRNKTGIKTVIHDEEEVMNIQKKADDFSDNACVPYHVAHGEGQ